MWWITLQQKQNRANQSEVIELVTSTEYMYTNIYTYIIQIYIYTNIYTKIQI